MKKRLISVLTAVVLAAALSVCPASPVSANGDSQIDFGVYAPGQYIAISYTGVTQAEVDDQAWIAIAPVGAAADNYLNWSYLQAGSGSVWLQVPDEEGSYEVRHFKGFAASAENLSPAPWASFTVRGERPSDDAPVYPSINDFDGSLVNYALGTRFWTGTYETNYKTLYLLQSGDTVTGEYPEWDNGRMDGTVIDGMLYGYWYEAPSYAPPNDAGQLVFAMHPDGQGFNGWWRYGNNGAWMDWSGGALNLQNTSADMEDVVYTADAHKLIPDSLQGADLTQPITPEEFSELAVRLFEELWKAQEETPFDPDNTTREEAIAVAERIFMAATEE